MKSSVVVSGPGMRLRPIPFFMHTVCLSHPAFKRPSFVLARHFTAQSWASTYYLTRRYAPRRRQNRTCSTSFRVRMMWVQHLASGTVKTWREKFESNALRSLAPVLSPSHHIPLL